MTLTKTHLIDAISETNGFPKNKPTDIIEILIDIIKSNLVSGENVLTFLQQCLLRSSANFFELEYNNFRKRKFPEENQPTEISPHTPITQLANPFSAVNLRIVTGGILSYLFKEKPYKLL